jgi:hypothetical protein
VKRAVLNAVFTTWFAIDYLTFLKESTNVFQHHQLYFSYVIQPISTVVFLALGRIFRDILKRIKPEDQITLFKLPDFRIVNTKTAKYENLLDCLFLRLSNNTPPRRLLKSCRSLTRSTMIRRSILEYFCSLKLRFVTPKNLRRRQIYKVL